ncbi:hypothetical protein SLS62_007902 [Diatrype stigma]|uniref:Uncharacterized protein n=1 Tax=Diatrype stigma TaxID=117547 RepID=A0AAN9YLX2_9PEZI
MVINTIYGYNSLGRAGPAASSPIFALDLDEVSTIVPGGQGATRQLSLSDLGTDCPRSLDPSVIATKLPDARDDDYNHAHGDYGLADLDYYSGGYGGNFYCGGVEYKSPYPSSYHYGIFGCRY